MKLNKTNRQAIADAALNHSGLIARKNAIRQRYADWMEEIRLLQLGGEEGETEVLALISQATKIYEQIPPDLRANRPKANTDYRRYNMNIAGQTRTMYWCGADKYNEAKNTEDYRLASNQQVVLVGGHPMVERLHQIDEDQRQVNEAIELRTAQLWALLNSVSTDAELYQLWPEAVAFAPVAERAAASTLPAVLVADLNKALGLP